MSDSPLYQMTKLEDAVIEGDPEKILEVMSKNGKRVSSASGLGIACAVKGLDTVKLMVENGATFKCPKVYIGEMVFGGQHTYDRGPFKKDADYCLYLLDHIYKPFNAWCKKPFNKWDNTGLLPLEKRVEVLEYLCENAEKVQLKKDILLYFSILDGCEEMYEVLKKYGAVLPEYITTMLTVGTGINVDWNNFLFFTRYTDTEPFLKTLGMLNKEFGETKLRTTESFFSYNKHKFGDPRVMEMLIRVFDTSAMNKTEVMRWFIDAESIPCLEFAEKQGWLEQPKLRDDMIEYSTKTKKTECSAWLLDFKNRTADFAKEAEKREKRLNSMLNASPDSVSELKKIWSYEKLEDGTLSIKSYKGNQSVVIVPKKIGGAAVTEIGAKAFSPHNSRISEERTLFRLNKIEKVILPDGLRLIELEAFYGCEALKEIEIPNSVKKIKYNALVNCGLEHIVIPEGVTFLATEALGTNDLNSPLKTISLPSTLDIFQEGGEVPFTSPIQKTCQSLFTVIIPDMPKAKLYCERHNFRYEIQKSVDKTKADDNKDNEDKTE